MKKRKDTVGPIPEITAHVSHHALKVRISGVLHLHVDKKKLLGVQSWYQGPDADRLYCIEIYLEGADPILTEYVDCRVWQKVLSLLDGLL